jgi:hypothetical protein
MTINNVNTLINIWKEAVGKTRLTLRDATKILDQDIRSPSRHLIPPLHRFYDFDYVMYYVLCFS